MKQRIQGIIIGLMLALTGITAYAAIGTQNIAVTYRDIKLYIDGALITPKDVNGNTVEPFIYNGTTYLPVRAVGTAFGKDVDFDEATYSVYVGARPGRPAIEVPLYNKPYLEVGYASGFSATGDERQNHIKITSADSAITKLSSGRFFMNDYVIYPLNAAATSFKATLNPPANEYSPELTYKIYGDGNLMYTSPILTPNAAAQTIEVNVSGVVQMRIEIELTATASYYPVTRNALTDRTYLGIENAVILTTDY